MKILFKNANVVSSEKIETRDVLVHDREISKIADNIDEGGLDAEYDLTGKYLMPGVIDAHVHFRSPGYEKKEDWESGSKAALAGGVTTVFDMPNTKPKTVTKEALMQKRDLARKNSLVNYGLFFGAMLDNIEEIKHVSGVVGLKVYMAETTGHMIMEKDARIDELLEELFTNHDFTVAVHAEDEEMLQRHASNYADEHKPEVHSLIRNDAIAFSAARRAVHLAKKHGGRLHLCHVSTKKEMELLSKYPDVTCEATPHHLFLTVKEYINQENFVKVNPPVRPERDREYLWDGMQRNLIDIIASDHAPHLPEEKKRDYWDAPSGVPGVETMLPLMLNAVNEGMLSLKDLVAMMCENITKIYPVQNKGYIREGYDADLTVVDLDIEKTVKNENLYTKCGWSPFEGRKLKGWPVMTFVRGRLGMKDGEIVKSENLHGKEVQTKIAG